MNSLIIKVNLIERVAIGIASWLEQKLSLDELEYLKIKLGLEVILINITKGIVVYGLAVILNIFFLTLILHCSYLLIRSKSFGLHAQSSLMCTFISIVIFVLIPLSVKNLVLGPVMISIIFLIAFCFLATYAPADTEKQPLIGANKREKLRLQSLKCCIILFLIALLFSMNHIGTMVTFGVGIQSVFILPITYKLLKRSYDNYEKYENELNESNETRNC